MPNSDDLTQEEIDVLRQIAEPEALLRLSVYFARPYIDFLDTLLTQERITMNEALQVAGRIGVRFDELAQQVPNINEHKSILDNPGNLEP